MAKKAGNPDVSSSSSFKLDRKTIEKNRRIHMKSLCSKLFNLVPPSHYKISKDLLSQQNQISYVIAYINELKERVENLEKRKQALQLRTDHSSHNYHDHHQANLDRSSTSILANNNDHDVTLPMVMLRDLGNDIVHIMLIITLNRSFTLNHIISVVEEEGGEVVNASLSTVGNKVFYSLHIEAKISRIGVDTSRVQQRLMNLVYQN